MQIWKTLDPTQILTKKFANFGTVFVHSASVQGDNELGIKICSSVHFVAFCLKYFFKFPWIFVGILKAIFFATFQWKRICNVRQVKITSLYFKNWIVVPKSV